MDSLFFAFDFLPLLEDGFRICGRFVAEDMGVAPDHFFGNSGRDFLQGEGASLASQLRVHHHLKQKVAQFLAEVRIVSLLDGINDLVALFDERSSEAGVRLLAVPRATIRRAQADDDSLEAGDGI